MVPSPLVRAGAAVMPIVQVMGTGSLMAAPTQAQITVGVQSVQPTAQAVQSTVSDALGRIATAIQALGIPPQRLQTTGVRLIPETRTDPATNTVRTVGFRGEQTLTVTTDNLSLVGPIIDTAVRNGANVIEAVSFSVRDPASLQLLALALAARDAQARALVLAQQFGLRLIGVQRVSMQAPVPIPLGVAFAAVAPTPVFPGMLTISGQVSVEYTAVPQRM